MIHVWCKMRLHLILFASFWSLVFCQSVLFGKNEAEYVSLLNEKLSMPINFEREGYWNSPSDRLIFYSMALKYAVDGEPEAEVKLNDTTVHFNLPLYVRMSQKVSRTLRIMASESEFYIHRHGAMKTATGSMAIGSGVLGIIGLVLAPFSGGASMALTLSSISLLIPSTIVDIVDGSINLSPEEFAKLAQNQMNQTQKNGAFIVKFLEDALDAFQTSQDKLTADDLTRIKTFFVVDQLKDEYEKQNGLLSKVNNHLLSKVKNPIMVGLKVKTVYDNAQLQKLITTNFNPLMNVLSGSQVIPPNESKKLLKLASLIFKPEVKNAQKAIDGAEIAAGIEDLFLSPDIRWAQNLDNVAGDITGTVQRRELLSLVSTDKDVTQIAGVGRIKSLARKMAIKRKFGGVPYAIGKNIYKKFSGSAFGQWLKIHAKGVKTALSVLGGVLDVISIGFGIYDVIGGVKDIHGSGTITDRLESLADEVDLALAGITAVYETMTDVPLNGLFKSPDQHYLTGVQFHPCNRHHAGTDYGINLHVHSRDTCSTGDLASFKSFYTNEWTTYEGAILDKCDQRLLRPADVKVDVTNSGTDAVCLDHVHLLTNHDESPKFDCKVQPEEVWIASDYERSNTAYTDKLDADCGIIKGVSQLKIIVSNHDFAGSTSSIFAKFFFSSSKTCQTKEFDNNGRDLATNSRNIYNSDILGDCASLEIDSQNDLFDENYVKIQLINSGSNALIVLGVEFYATVDDLTLRFKCNIAELQTGFYMSESNYDLYTSNSDIDSLKCEVVEKSYDLRELHAIQINVGSQSSGTVQVKICSGGNCCQTPVFYDLQYYVDQVFQPDEIGTCENFRIENNTAQVYVKSPSTVINSIQLFNTQNKMLTSMTTCHFTIDFIETSSVSFQGPTLCTIATDFTLQSVKIGVCDKVHAGTDSSIFIEVCSDNGCCTSNILDQVGNDLERGDYITYSANILGSCSNFPVSSDNTNVTVINKGTDALCMDRFQIRTSGSLARNLNCFIPAEKEFWVDYGQLKMRCG